MKKSAMQEKMMDYITDVDREYEKPMDKFVDLKEKYDLHIIIEYDIVPDKHKRLSKEE